MRSCSLASASCTTARRSRTPSRRARRAGGRSTLRWPRSTRGEQQPSIEWRRKFSLLLGLERLLSEEEPHLADGTVLSAHQVDALSGTLTALLAEAQRNGIEQQRRRARRPSRRSSRRPRSRARRTRSTSGDEDEEPQDWQDEGELDEDVQAEAPEDPNADKRFWFEHATGAGKTVAALGFVEASRTGGILILTHRRNLVDQFHGELRDRGYRDRIQRLRCSTATTPPTARSRSRPTSGSCATPAASPTRTRS